MVTDRARRELFDAAERELGAGPAETLMELLPPVGWADVARRGDMVALRGEMAELRGEMAELRSDLRGEMADLRSELRGEVDGLRQGLERVELRLEAIREHLTGLVLHEVGGLRVELAGVVNQRRMIVLTVVSVAAALATAVLAGVALTAA